MPLEKLSDDQIAQHLSARPEWSETGEAIQRTYAFKNFAESMKFVGKVADAAEAADHHPDILIRYNKVTLTLSTHDAGGITAKDFDLAGKADEFAAPMLVIKKK
jgi:4a-hydroxytetrahydrobiopterin dehydratase